MPSQSNSKNKTFDRNASKRKMADVEVENKRKRKGMNPVILKRLKTIEEKQDKSIFAFGKMLQLVLKTHQLVEKNQAVQDDDMISVKKGCQLNSLFSKASSKTGLTRAYVYADTLCENIYPTDVELCNAFLAKREGVEAKEVKKWWNVHRHKIIKFNPFYL